MKQERECAKDDDDDDSEDDDALSLTERWMGRQREIEKDED